MALVLNSNAMVDLDSFKVYAKEYTTEVNSLALLRDFINEASQLCESYCNRFFRERTITQIISGGSTYEIMLNQWPINSIDEVYFDAKHVFDASSLVPASSYIVGENEKGEGISIEMLAGRFPRGRKNIKIVYKAGYPNIADLPADLQLACKRTAAYYYKQQQNEDFIENAKSKGGENITLIDGLPLSASLLLDPHVRMEVLGGTDPVRNL